MLLKENGAIVMTNNTVANIITILNSIFSINIVLPIVFAKILSKVQELNKITPQINKLWETNPALEIMAITPKRIPSGIKIIP